MKVSSILKKRRFGVRVFTTPDSWPPASGSGRAPAGCSRRDHMQPSLIRQTSCFIVPAVRPLARCPHIDGHSICERARPAAVRAPLKMANIFDKNPISSSKYRLSLRVQRNPSGAFASLEVRALVCLTFSELPNFLNALSTLSTHKK